VEGLDKSRGYSRAHTIPGGFDATSLTRPRQVAGLDMLRRGPSRRAVKS
jgi:hypothetical protein